MIYRGSHRRCSLKKVFLEISQNSQENTVPGSFFNKVAGLLFWITLYLNNKKRNLAQNCSKSIIETIGKGVEYV